MLDAMDEDEGIRPDYLAALRRRKWYLITLIPLLLVVSVLLAVLLPPIYRSSGTILVETQQIPQNLVQSTITSAASERIQVIQQRVMSREKLLDIVDKHNLFKEERQSYPVSILLDQLRQNIFVNFITANNRRNTATIAFTVAFEDRSPNTAQAIANDLVSLFLTENVKARTERAVEASEFLSNESEKLKKQLDEIETLLADFKQENKDALPEHLNLYMGMLDRVHSGLQETEREIKSLTEQKSLLEINLKTFQAQNQNKIVEHSVTKEETFLQELKDEYTRLSVNYNSAHPDLVNLREKIASYERSLKPSVLYRVINENILQVKIELENAKRDYTDEHPEVKRLQSNLSALEFRLLQLPAEEENNSNNISISPAELEIKTRIVSTQSRIDSLMQQRSKLEEKVEDLQVRVIKIPQVERGLKTLNRDYINTTQRYNQISSKGMDAKLSESLEEGRKAERFSILEPPLFPDQPIKPDRKKILMIGIFLSIFSPFGVIVLKEISDQGIHGSNALAAITKAQPLVVIPYLETNTEIHKKKLKLLMISVLVIVILIGGLLTIHFFYKPLDLLWFKILHRWGV